MTDATLYPSVFGERHETELNLVALDAFTAFCRFADSFPMLSEERETALAKKLRDEADAEAARELVTSHLRLVARIAREHKGYGLPPEDLAQEGTVGLMKAVRRFDPERGARLAAYAVLWIKAEIQEYIQENWRLVKLASTKGLKKLFFGLQKTRAALGIESPGKGTALLAERLGVREDEVSEAESWFEGGELSTDLRVEDGACLGDVLADPSPSPEQVYETKRETEETEKGVNSALALLSERERLVVASRIMAEKKKSLAEIGEEIGVSQERVRQIEAGALKKMREALSNN